LISGSVAVDLIAWHDRTVEAARPALYCLVRPADYPYLEQRIIKIGTLCYVVDSCLASPRTQCAVGKIVEVVSLPYNAPDWTYLPGIYYDVRFEGCIFYCRSDKLRPISDPDADITELQDDTVTA
jgi:hypothetical protein